MWQYDKNKRSKFSLYIILKICKEVEKDYFVVFNYYCGAKRFGKPGQFHIKPKAHAEKEETSKDEY